MASAPLARRLFPDFFNRGGVAISSSSSFPVAANAPSRSQAIATESLDDAFAAAPSRAHAASFARSPGDDATTSKSGVSGTKLSSSSSPSPSSSPSASTCFGVGSALASTAAADARSLASFLRRQLLSLGGLFGRLASPTASWGSCARADSPGSDSATTSASKSFESVGIFVWTARVTFTAFFRLFCRLRFVRFRTPPSFEVRLGAIVCAGDMNGFAVRTTSATNPPTRRSITATGDIVECDTIAVGPVPPSGPSDPSSRPGWLSCDCVPSIESPELGSSALRESNPGAAVLNVFLARLRLFFGSTSSASAAFVASRRLRFSVFFRLRCVGVVVRSARAACAARLCLAIAAARDAPTALTGAPHSCRCDPCLPGSEFDLMSADGTKTLPWTSTCVMSASPTRSWKVLQCFTPSSDVVAADATDTSRSGRPVMLAPPGVPRSGGGGSRAEGARLRRTP